MTNVSTSIAQSNVAYLQQPSVVRLDDRETVVGYDPLPAGRQDGAGLLSGSFLLFPLLATCGIRRILARRAGIVGVAPNDCVIVEVFCHTGEECVLPDDGNDGLIAGGAGQIGQVARFGGQLSAGWVAEKLAGCDEG